MKNHDHTQPFWSGFSLGLLGGTALMYLMATKRGRETMRKLLDHSESLETNIEHIVKTIQKHVENDTKQEIKK